MLKHCDLNQYVNHSTQNEAKNLFHITKTHLFSIAVRFSKSVAKSAKRFSLQKNRTECQWFTAVMLWKENDDHITMQSNTDFVYDIRQSFTFYDIMNSKLHPPKSSGASISPKPMTQTPPISIPLSLLPFPPLFFLTLPFLFPP